MAAFAYGWGTGSNDVANVSRSWLLFSRVSSGAASAPVSLHCGARRKRSCSRLHSRAAPSYPSQAFGTSVGAKTLTLKQAVIIAAIFEFTGAVVLGRVSTSTIARGIANINVFYREPEVRQTHE
jgi:phosphate/sulfate permease